jgi:serine/threonine protein kinase
MSRAEELGPGAQVGDYRLVRKLGEGGFGGVWQAHSVHAPGVQVALKLGWESEAGRKAGGRGRRELRVLLELDHPHIVRPLAHGLFPACPGGRPYLVMEYVEGEALDAWARRANPSLEALADVFRKLLSALAHAHARGVLHRDVKPGNVWVDVVGQPKLLDWGAGDAAGALTLTERGLPPGTPGYRSPQAELFGGPGAYSCSPLDDLYALGVTLYVALTEVHPFPFESREQLSLAVAQGRAVAPHALNPRVPAALGEWVSRLMARRVEERFASASEALEALRGVLALPGVDYSERVYEAQPETPPREAPTLPPTTGDGPPARDVEVRAHHVLSALWDRSTDVRHEAALARRDALLEEVAAREEAGAVPARDGVSPGAPESAPSAPELRPARSARGRSWALGGALVLAACAGLLWKGWAARPPVPFVTPSRAESVPPASAAPATLTSASALPAAPAKEGPFVNPSPLPSNPPSSPDSRRPRLAARAARCVVGATLALTQVACPGIPLRPAEESCPAGALQTIKDLGYEPERTMEIWLDARLPDDAEEAVVREGPITSEVVGPSKYEGAKLAGRIIFGGNGKVYVRYTAITVKGGRTQPFCAQVGTRLDPESVGLRMGEGSTPQSIKMWSRVPGFMVDHFN